MCSLGVKIMREGCGVSMVTGKSSVRLSVCPPNCPNLWRMIMILIMIMITSNDMKELSGKVGVSGKTIYSSLGVKHNTQLGS